MIVVKYILALFLMLVIYGVPAAVVYGLVQVAFPRLTATLAVLVSVHMVQ